MDPTQQLTHFADTAWQWAAAFVPHLAAAVAVLVAGAFVAGWFDRALRRALANVTHIDSTLKPVLAAVTRYAVLVLVAIVALSQLGVQTASLLAVVGAAGLAIGLALQGTLSNIAAGIMLLWLRPFRIGDYIEVGGQGGAVEEIGLFSCRLRTFDGLYLFLPNSAIWNAPLKNHTRNGGRLLSIDVSLPGTTDLERARQALLDVAAKTAGVLPAPPPQAFFASFAGGALVLSLTVWTTAQGAGAVERGIVEGVKRALDALGDNFKPAQIVRTVPPDADPSRFFGGNPIAK
ncbi:MAG: mechanosensitive ion channel family protein [Alphaproteobacteria bacterium]|nr:mechanosensitive ion channel family protein [Alphaproteobacteria bacterium]